MDDSGGKMLRQYLHVLRRRWILIGLLVALTSGTALLASLRMTPIYRADTEVNVTPFASSSSQMSGLLNALTDPTTALQTDVALMESDGVLSRAATTLGLASSLPLKSTVKAQVVAGTQIIDIRASSPVRAEAKAWADAVAAAFIASQRDQAIAQVTAASQDLQQRISILKLQLPSPGSAPISVPAEAALTSQINALQVELDTLPGASSIVSGGGSVIAAAVLPTDPVSPNKRQNTLLGAVVGLMLAVGLVLLIEALDDRLRGADEVEARTGVPALGLVPYTKELARAPQSAALVHQPTSAVAEAFRTLRTNLRFLSLDHPLRTLLITSSVKGEGKSTTSANLAAAFAASGVRTILVSADLRRPSLHRFFGLENSAGLVDALLPGVALDRLLQTNEIPDLRLLAAGRTPPNPTEILGSARFSELLDVLSEQADLVIVDCTPVLGVADAGALASQVDGVLLVVNPKEVDRRALEHAVEQLRKAGGSLLGTVLNAVAPSAGYGYDYDYDYASETDRGKAKRAQKPPRARHRRRERGFSPDALPSVEWAPAAGRPTPSVRDTHAPQRSALPPDPAHEREVSTPAGNADRLHGSRLKYSQPTASESSQGSGAREI